MMKLFQKKWQPVHKYDAEEYLGMSIFGKVFKVTGKHIGLVLDNIIPMTFGLLTLIGWKLFGKELFRFEIKDNWHRLVKLGLAKVQ